jgi:hypothetical protein
LDSLPQVIKEAKEREYKLSKEDCTLAKKVDWITNSAELSSLFALGRKGCVFPESTWIIGRITEKYIILFGSSSN